MKYTIDGYDHNYGRNEYKILENGMAYPVDTPDDLIEILEKLREARTRVTFEYGNINTGVSWNKEYDITGYIGRSNGKFKVPLLINNTRSYGGSSLSTDCVLSIKYSNKANGGYIYKFNQSVTANIAHTV